MLLTKRSVIPLVLLLFLFPIAAANAMTFRSGEKLYISIPFADDLYIGAGTVTIKEDVSGDVTVIGGEVLIRSDVSQDLNIAGGRVEVEGNVGDDLRIGGGEVRIDGLVADDLMVFGGEVRLTDKAKVSGDVVVQGGDITVDGEIQGKTRIEGGVVTVRGPLQKEADLRAASLTLENIILGNATIAAEKLTLGEKARFGGDLQYWLRGGEREFSPAILRGTATFDPSLSPTTGRPAGPSGLPGVFFAALNLFSILSAALLILLLALATKTFFQASAKTLQKNPVKCALVGLLYFILAPVVAVLLLASIIGFPLGLYVLVLFAFSVLFAKALTAMVLAKWMEMRYRRDWGVLMFTLISLGFFVVLKFLIVIPFVGWIALFALICCCFGALLKVKWERIRKIL